jgi:hypothetical protein
MSERRERGKESERERESEQASTVFFYKLSSLSYSIFSSSRALSCNDKINPLLGSAQKNIA